MVGTIMAAKQASNMGRRSVKHPVISVTKKIPVTGARTTAVKKAAMPTRKSFGPRATIFLRVMIF